MTPENKKLLEILEQSAVAIYSLDSLTKKLKSGKKLVVKLGADPSRPDLHLGHSVTLRIMQAFQQAGHEVVFLIGDFTAMIGDPSGKSKTRPSLTFEETRANARTYLEQVGKILDIDKTTIRYNSEWLGKMNFEDVLKLTSKYTLARLLERDDFAKRYNENKPIGMHELMYPLMQGYDSVALECDIEIGGTDQTFNLLVGRELQKDYKQEPQEVLVFPLLVGLDGVNKMSKSLDNYIGVDESPEIMFEKCMKIPDNLLEHYFILTTTLDINEVKEIIKKDIVQAHVHYAKYIVTLYHGEKHVQGAYARYKEIAKGNIPTNVQDVVLDKDNMNIINALILAGFANSNSQARRLIEQNGVKINGETCIDWRASVKVSDVISKGKNNFVKIVN